MGSWGLRLRAFVTDNYRAILLGVVLVGALGGYLTYVGHVDPGTQTETREVSSWETNGTFTHQATVVNGTTLFATGEILRDRSVYFKQVTPRLNGSFSYTYRATAGGDVDVETTIARELRSVANGDEKNESTVFWRDRQVLNRSVQQSLSPGERTNISFSTNVSAAAETVERIDDRLGGTPGELEILVVATVEATGTRNGQLIDETRTYRLPIEPEDGVYRVSDPGTVSAADEQTEQVTVPVKPGPLRIAGGPLLIAVALGVVVGVLYAKRTGQLSMSELEREWLAFQSDREAFDEWITAGHVPSFSEQTEAITVDSLQGVVDIAIDANNRVIEDERRNAYFVLAGDERYRFDRPQKPSGDGQKRPAPGEE